MTIISGSLGRVAIPCLSPHLGNGYPRYIRTKMIKHLQSRQKDERNNDDQDKENLLLIF